MSRSVRHSHHIRYSRSLRSLKKWKRMNNRILRRKSRSILRSSDPDAISLPFRLEDVMGRYDYPDDSAMLVFTPEDIIRSGVKLWHYTRK